MKIRREIRRRKLRDLIQDVSKGNIADFARKIDKEASYVARMLYPEDKPGAKPIGEKMISHICHTLVLPFDWFDRDYDDETTPFLEQDDELIIIDVLNVEASAGHSSLGDLVKTVRQLRYFPDQFYSLFRGLNPDVIQVINVKGDSMSPTFAPGDLAFVDVSIQYFDGDGVYVFNYGDSLYLKRLQKAGNEFIVISDNDTYREWRISADHADELFIHGKVKVHQSQRLNFIG